jgi:lipopolysaccharide heptosyltransferase III
MIPIYPGLRNILVIQLGDIGDVVLSTPTIRAFRETYPDARVSVIVRKGYGSLLTGDPHLFEVLEVTKTRSKLLEASENFRLAGRLRRARYDLVFDLRTGDRGAILALLSRAPVKVAFGSAGASWRRYVFSRLIRGDEVKVTPPPAHPGADQSLRLVAPIGVGTSDSRPKLYVTEQVAASVCRLLAAEGLPGDARFITVNPFSRWKYKEWGYGKWVEVLDGVRDRYGLPALVVGAKEEAEAAAGIATRCKPEARSVAGKTTLGELAALLSRSSLHLGVDSAAPHIACAVGTPTVTIFGPSDWRGWTIPDATHRVVDPDDLCVPCHKKGCDHTEVSRCLDNLEMEKVLREAGEALETSGSFPTS